LEPPNRATVHRSIEQLNRVGRLVAAGSITHPFGHLVIVRASRVDEAARILRSDPWRDVEGIRYEIVEWDPDQFAGGVNLEPAPALGSGRLTALERVAVVVRDQAVATAWYRDVLGLKVREEDPATGFVEVSLGRGAAALSLVCPRPEWGEPYYSETRARIGAATGIVFRTDSVAALELRLRHARGTITEGRRPQPWGGETLRFCDPDGNEFLAFQSGPPGPAAADLPLRPEPAAPRAARRALRRRRPK
jgi:catechol 2,3-dioxygenase-like lactoylglutathione lyase family enzyme